MVRLYSGGCVWPVFLGGLEGSAKQSFCEVFFCFVLPGFAE